MAFRVLYFGTPGFAVPALQRLIGSTYRVVGVVTQPDRPRGRGQKVVAEAVKVTAVAHGLPVFQPTRLKDPAFLDTLRALEPDLGVVAAYGRILPAELLALPRFGLINVHGSLLPRWRGAAPVHRAILAGDVTTGVTIMRVVQALDAGPMLARVTTDIDPAETSVDLERRLASAGAGVLLDTMDRLASGQAVVEETQDEQFVTYASRLERKDSQVDWSRSALEIHNRIRGLQPWPLAAAMLHDRRLLLLRSAVDATDTGATPGVVAGVSPDAIAIGTGSGTVRLLEIQPEGRAAMHVRAFLSGHRVAAGDRFSPVPVSGP